MEINTSTTKFQNLNFNLKKIIFDYLKLCDQRTIYWTNKKLRRLLPDSAMRINIDLLKKRLFCQLLDDKVNSLFELNDGSIACWTKEEIKILKLHGDKLELIKSFNTFLYKTDERIFHIQQENGNIIFNNYCNYLVFCDKDFNVFESFKVSSKVYSLCNISKQSFAVGFCDSSLKIYSMNSKTKKYNEVKEYDCHEYGILNLVYLPKKNYFLWNSVDDTINVLKLSEKHSFKKIEGHDNTATSLILLNDETFASSSIGDIKIWSIKENFECIKTIYAHEDTETYIFLNLLGKDFMVSRSEYEFKIWDGKTYECLITHKEDSYIRHLIVTKNNNIITATEDKKVNVWKIIRV
jgi:hypothetical protein